MVPISYAAKCVTEEALHSVGLLSEEIVQLAASFLKKEYTIIQKRGLYKIFKKQRNLKRKWYLTGNKTSGFLLLKIKIQPKNASF